jgi:7-carboxy-7-deazaguanine synthase
MTISEILQKTSAHACRLVEITGGEPLLQADTPRLIERLLEAGHEVMLETNGSKDIRAIDTRCIKIVDIKCPSSGESPHNRLENMKRLGPNDQVKFVMSTREDYEFAVNIIDSLPPAISAQHILLSPVTGVLSPAQLAAWMLDDRLEGRLHIQLHKIIWPFHDRGV